MTNEKMNQIVKDTNMSERVRVQWLTACSCEIVGSDMTLSTSPVPRLHPAPLPSGGWGYPCDFYDRIAQQRGAESAAARLDTPIVT